MQFSTLFAMATAIAAVAANSVQFVNQDSTTRTIVFTAQEGQESLSDLVISGLDTATQSFPDSWIGNWYSVSEGKENVPGMLGEVRFDGFAGATYFDVSAIVNADDTEGVKEIYPKEALLPMSGCQTFPCSNAYNKWDDVETTTTSETDLVCLIGNLSSSSKRADSPRVTRRFIQN